MSLSRASSMHVTTRSASSRGQPVAAPELTAATLHRLQEGALNGKKAANTEPRTPNALATTALSTKRAWKTESADSAASWLCSVDALMMADGAVDVAEAASETDTIPLSTNGHRLSLSIITDTDIADECLSYASFADGSLSSSLPFPLTRAGCGPQSKPCHFQGVVARGRMSVTPISLCTDIVHTDATALSEAMTAGSGITSASVQHPSTTNTGARLRQARTRAWVTAVPQNRHVLQGSVTPLVETPEIEDLVSPTSSVPHRCHRAISCGTTELSESVIEEDIQCEDESPEARSLQQGTFNCTLA